MPTTLTRSAEQVILVASMIASRLLLGPCAALQQVQVLLEVAIQHHYDIMPAQHFEHRFQRLHGPSQETKLKLQLLLASLRSKCAATPEGAAGAAISIPRGMSARGINWLHLLLAACAPVHAPLTRGHRLPPGTPGPSGSPGGARP